MGLGIEPATQVSALNWNLNPQPFGAQDGILNTEKHWPDISIDFLEVVEGREGEREKDRNIDVRETHTLVPSRMHSNRAGNKPAT